MKEIKITNKILELMYPPKCPLCGEKLVGRSGDVCEDCREQTNKIGESFCIKCGKELEEAEREFCQDCEKYPHIFVQNRGLFPYSGCLKGSIYRYKYQNQRYYAQYYAKELVAKFGEQIKSWGVEALLPVPLHKSREKKRGFNQAEELLKYMEKPLGIPLYRNYVLREKKTLPQKYLNQAGRQKNLKNAFKIAENSVKLNRVLVCDDIYTTGSTLDAVAQALKQTGVREVYGLCICIGRGR